MEDADIGLGESIVNQADCSGKCLILDARVPGQFNKSSAFDNFYEEVL